MAEHSQLDILNALVNQHEADIQIIKADMSAVKASTVSILAKVDALSSAIMSRGQTTVTDIAQWLQILVLGSALIGGIVTGIIYIATNNAAAEMAVMQYRIDKVERAVTIAVAKRAEG